MTVIVFVNSKGGVGKSTAAINVAEAYRVVGRKVLLVDYDPNQASTSRWKRTAEDQGHKVVPSVKVESELPKVIREFKQEFEIIVIDGPANLTNANSALISVADLVILPVQASQLDLWACEPALSSIEERQDVTGGVPEARFLISKSHADPRVDAMELAKLADTGVEAFKSRLVNRVNFTRTIGRGQSVYFLPKSDKARQDIEQLFTEIDDVCNNLPAG